MSHHALLLGSTGLIGSHLCDLLLQDDHYGTITTINRRVSGRVHNKLVERVVDFEELEDIGGLPKADHAFCALGTTMKKAGSKEAFYRVDFDYVLSFGKLAKTLGCQTFVLVSSMGANAQSMVFYNQVKGEIEEAIKELNFSTTHIIRPSLLLGNRNERRIGEQFGELVANTFSFLIPKNYQAINATDVARFMKDIALSQQSGNHIHLSGSMQPK